MPFSSLFGLQQSVQSLRRALQDDHLAGTYLFIGPGGVGKTALANAFAQAAACLTPRSNPWDACGVCESCVRLQAGTHPEVVLIPPAGDQTQIWQFWDRDNRPPGILQHSLNYAPTIGRKRVYILERADTLNEATANSLLKVLEEPPSYALFILLSPHAARMLPTILSRSQIVRLTPSPVPQLAAYLCDTLGLEPERARTFAAYAEGRTGTALRLARNPTVEAELAKALDFTEAVLASPPIRALRVAENLRKFASSMKALTDTEEAPAAKGSEAAGEDASETGSKERVGRRQLGAAIDLLAAVYRDVLLLRLGGEGAPIVHGDRRKALLALAERRTPEGWMANLQALMQARRRVDQNASVPILTDWLAMELVNNRG